MKSHRAALSCSVVKDLRSALGLPLHLSSSYVLVDSIFNPQESSKHTGAGVGLGMGVSAEQKIDSEKYDEGEDEIIYPNDTNGNGGQRPVERGVEQAHRRRIQHLNAFLTEGVSTNQTDRRIQENVRSVSIAPDLI
jgi:hypothetical protein